MSPWGLQDLFGFIAGSTSFSEGPSGFTLMGALRIGPYPETYPTFTLVERLGLRRFSVTSLTGGYVRLLNFLCWTNLVHMLLHSADGSITRNVSRRNFLLRSLWHLDNVFPFFFSFICFLQFDPTFHLISPCLGHLYRSQVFQRPGSKEHIHERSILESASYGWLCCPVFPTFNFQ